MDASRARDRTGDRLAEAAALLKTAKKPLLISGGGVRYSLAETGRRRLRGEARHPDRARPSPARAAVTHDHPAHVGPIGIIGSTSANALAAEADVILAVGTRLMDFTTGSWTAFSPEAQFISINAARFDAIKHRALAVVGDALETIDGARRGARRLARRSGAAGARKGACSRNGTRRSTAIRRRPTRRSRPMRRSSAP